MTITRLEIPDVLLISPTVFGDARGYFLESFRADKLAEFGVTAQFVQDNMSSSTRNVVRGLHYQKDPYAQGKLVRVIEGEVFDVAVDIRADSPWYGRWVGRLLSAENKESMYVPPGFAHGFCVVSETAQFHYKCTGYYAPEYERSVLWRDAALGIDWPVSADEAILSEKDATAPVLAVADNTYVYTEGAAGRE